MELNTLKTDDNGHLLDYSQWSKEIGIIMAKKDGFNLSDEHWPILLLIREIYLQTQTTPPMRLFIKAIKHNLSDDLASSRYLYRLFPDGPIRLACKYAGLSKPKHCM